MLLVLVLAAALIFVIEAHMCVFRGYKGRIIDGATGTPIKDAIIVAQWPLQGDHGVYYSMLELTEVETDANGVFILPPWFIKVHFGEGGLDYVSPQILIYKKGYAPQIFYNNNAKSPIGWPFYLKLNVEKSDLVLYGYSGEQKALGYESMRRFLHFAFPGAHCEWIGIPKLLNNFLMLGRELKTEGAGISLLDERSLNHACGNPLKILNLQFKKVPEGLKNVQLPKK